MEKVNYDQLTQQEIKALQARVRLLSQELWETTQQPNRINLLTQLNSAVGELLLLESNQYAREEALRGGSQNS